MFTRLFRFSPTIRQLLSTTSNSHQVTVSGWIKSIRRQKNVSFAVITDGSSATGLQAVFAGAGNDSPEVKKLSNGSAVKLTGRLVASPGAGQAKELVIEHGAGGRVELLRECPHQTYPIQKQALSNEYLRDHAHLRARTDKIASMIRLRSVLHKNIHGWFEHQGFHHVNTPILTGNDAEGAGEAFRLAPIHSEHPAAATAAAAAPQHASPALSPADFFSRPTFLTVSHQLHLEALASALSRVYTLSPCFRAEPSLTARHLAEFWMLEAEWAFDSTSPSPPTECGRPSDAEELCQAVEAMLRSVVGSVVSPDRHEDVSVLWKQNDEGEKRLASLEKGVTSEAAWTRMTYAEAIKELQQTYVQKTAKFQYEPGYGKGLQSEHERWLAEQLVGGPVFVTDYPSALKPFYMRVNPSGSTVACFDLLIPHVGELVGGSVREDRLDVLSERMEQAGTGGREYEWYRDLRRFGGAPHGGFGMGFERLVTWVGGIENVREAIPMPRWAGRMLL